MQFGSITLEVGADGVAIALFDRPPVNAVSLSVYGDLGDITAYVGASTTVRVLVLTAPETARAWCGGADLRDFVGMDPMKRKERYAHINARLPGLFSLDRPVIAAINGHTVGIGMILAALCDMRIAAEEAMFGCPEIDYGLVAGGAGLFALLKMPEAKVREMLFTGRKFTARELEPTGFFNSIVPKHQVLPSALDLARQIAGKSLPALRARKAACARLEGRTWMDAYLDAQSLSAALAAGADGGEGVEAFLERREPKLRDR